MKKTNSFAGFGFLFATGAALVSPVHEWVTREPLYREVVSPNRGSAWRRLIGGLADRLERHRQHRKQLRSLAMLDDHMLRDIGLTREDVQDQLKRSGWR